MRKYNASQDLHVAKTNMTNPDYDKHIELAEFINALIIGIPISTNNDIEKDKIFILLDTIFKLSKVEHDNDTKEKSNVYDDARKHLIMLIDNIQSIHDITKENLAKMKETLGTLSLTNIELSQTQIQYIKTVIDESNALITQLVLKQNPIVTQKKPSKLTTASHLTQKFQKTY